MSRYHVDIGKGYKVKEERFEINAWSRAAEGVVIAGHRKGTFFIIHAWYSAKKEKYCAPIRVHPSIEDNGQELGLRDSRERKAPDCGTRTHSSMHTSSDSRNTMRQAAAGALRRQVARTACTCRLRTCE